MHLDIQQDLFSIAIIGFRHQREVDQIIKFNFRCHSLFFNIKKSNTKKIGRLGHLIGKVHSSNMVWLLVLDNGFTYKAKMEKYVVNVRENYLKLYIIIQMRPF